MIAGVEAIDSFGITLQGLKFTPPWPAQRG